MCFSLPVNPMLVVYIYIYTTIYNIYIYIYMPYIYIYIYIYMAVRANEWSILNQGTMYPILEVVRMLDFTGHFICLYHLNYK